MAGMSIDMFVDPDPRSEPPPQGGELETLSGFLRWQRETLELKCSGLDAAGLARRSVEPSSMSLLGLLRHLADVERGWFRSFMAGQDAPSRFSSREDPDGDFDGARPDDAVVPKDFVPQGVLHPSGSWQTAGEGGGGQGGACLGSWCSCAPDKLS